MADDKDGKDTPPSKPKTPPKKKEKTPTKPPVSTDNDLEQPDQPVKKEEPLKELLTEVRSLKKQITAFEEKGTQKQYESMRNEKLAKLEVLDEHMAAKYAKESDLDKLDMAIEVVTSHAATLDDRFPDFQQVKKGEKPKNKPLSGVNPLTGEIE